MNTAADLYPRPGEFERLLSDAERNARNGWEEDFTDSMRVRFDQYGDQINLTIRQVEKLEQIANR